MKKLVAIMFMAVLCVLILAGCNSVPKEDYDKLYYELTTVQEENEILKQKDEWLKKYQSVKFAKTKEDIYKIVIAATELSKAKTGALIVIERDIKIQDIISTGIPMNAEVSPQLLVNIFEPKTPLHDGAVVISGNKISAAACVLPLADDKDIAKELGTRHRAALGIAEESDALALVVSEETGKISVAYNGEIERNLSGDALKEKLRTIQNKPEVESRKRILWKGRSKGEK